MAIEEDEWLVWVKVEEELRLNGDDDMIQDSEFYQIFQTALSDFHYLSIAKSFFEFLTQSSYSKK